MLRDRSTQLERLKFSDHHARFQQHGGDEIGGAGVCNIGRYTKAVGTYRYSCGCNVDQQI